MRRAAAVLLVLLVARPAHANPACEAAGGIPGRCVSTLALRQCDDDQSALDAIRVAYAERGRRLVLALGTSRELGREVRLLMEELRAEQASWPRWVWWGIGVLSGLVAALAF